MAVYFYLYESQAYEGTSWKTEKKNHKLWKITFDLYCSKLYSWNFKWDLEIFKTLFCAMTNCLSEIRLWLQFNSAAFSVFFLIYAFSHLMQFRMNCNSNPYYSIPLERFLSKLAKDRFNTVNNTLQLLAHYNLYLNISYDKNAFMMSISERNRGTNTLFANFFL